jgi:hypothetical protein
MYNPNTSPYTFQLICSRLPQYTDDSPHELSVMQPRAYLMQSRTPPSEQPRQTHESRDPDQGMGEMNGHEPGGPRGGTDASWRGPWRA